MWAVVPVKPLAQAKQRLAGVLATEERVAFSRAMLEDVLFALRETAAFERICVLSPDDGLLSLSTRAGAELLREPGEGGLNGAVAWGMAQAAPHSLLVIAADIPRTTSEDLSAVLAAAPEERGLAIVSDRHRLGTNLLLLRPADLISPRFGEGSFELHQQEARKRGCEPIVLDLPNLQLDIDLPEDLLLLADNPGGRRTARLLAELGLSRDFAGLAGAKPAEGPSEHGTC